MPWPIAVPSSRCCRGLNDESAKLELSPFPLENRDQRRPCCPDAGELPAHRRDIPHDPLRIRMLAAHRSQTDASWGGGRRMAARAPVDEEWNEPIVDDHVRIRETPPKRLTSGRFA